MTDAAPAPECEVCGRADGLESFGHRCGTCGGPRRWLCREHRPRTQPVGFMATLDVSETYGPSPPTAPAPKPKAFSIESLRRAKFRLSGRR